MSFATIFALFAAVFVAAPLVAHMLRRRQTEERFFSAVSLVPATPPEAKRRSKLDDRALFALRALSVLALAILGATPFVQCNRLSLNRQGGASVALGIVVDDSLSMRASAGDGVSRFDLALRAASELLDGAAEGDTVAIIVAGSPARVALGSTTNLTAARETLQNLAVSDRATDLEGAIELAASLLRDAPQPDRRIVLLSDLADGHPEAALPDTGAIRLWAPLSELAADANDCAVLHADQTSSKVRVQIRCTSNDMPPRTVVLRAGETLLDSAPLLPKLGSQDLLLDAAKDPISALDVALEGPADAIAEDDRAAVLPPGGSLAVAVVADEATSQVATGGAPPIEQALLALHVEADVRPLPAVPEHAGDLDAFAAIVVDDAPGLTPEVRRAFAAWIERGHVALITLGPRAASAPLGAGFEPMIPGVVRWGASPAKGLAQGASSQFGAAADGLTDLAPEGRATLAPEALRDAKLLATWSDDAPFLAERRMGRGHILVLTLPLSADTSDFVLRPAFLSLLDRFVASGASRGGARRIDAGKGWSFDRESRVEVERLSFETQGKPTPVPVLAEGAQRRVVAALAGRYTLVIDGVASTRVVAVPEREIDLRPRPTPSDTGAQALGGSTASVDLSPEVAVALMALLAAEAGLRVWARYRAQTA